MAGVAQLVRLLRPYIPWSVRYVVACRQYRERFGREWTCNLGGHQRQTRIILMQLFPEGGAQLDHEPALENREKVFRDGVHVDYIPAANDPDHLAYRSAHDHYLKTHVRGAYGAQYSDTVLAKRERRRKKKKRKFNWPKRKLQSGNRWNNGNRKAGSTKIAKRKR